MLSLRPDHHKRKRAYSSKPVTFEFGRARSLQIVIIVLIAFQMFTCLAILITGCVALLQCDEAEYAGVAPIIAAFIVLSSIGTSFFTFKSENRLVSLLCTIFSVLISLLLMMNEVTSFVCAGSTNRRSYCVAFKASTNLCGGGDVEFQAPESSQPQTFKRSIVTSRASVGTKTYVPEVASSTDVSDTFRTGQCALVVLSFLSVTVSLSTLITTLMSGHPVYLFQRRSRNFFVVGDIKNVALAFENEEKNVQLTSPTAEELRRYDDRRSAFGGKKIVTSTIHSVYGKWSSGTENSMTSTPPSRENKSRADSLPARTDRHVKLRNFHNDASI